MCTPYVGAARLLLHIHRKFTVEITSFVVKLLVITGYHCQFLYVDLGTKQTWLYPVLDKSRLGSFLLIFREDFHEVCFKRILSARKETEST